MQHSEIIQKQFEPESLFLKSESAAYNYKNLILFADHFSDFLQQYDISEEHPLGLYASSCDTLIFIIAACWLNEIPFVSFNPETKSSRLTKQIHRFEPGIIISDKNNRFGQVQNIDIKKLDLREILEKGTASPARFNSDLISKKEAIFGYFLTSGTSGEPKTVPLKRRQMITAAQNSAENLHPSPNEFWLLCMPLYHIGGISVILRSLFYGSGIFRMEQFDAGKVAQKLSNDKNLVAASLVPTMLKRLLDHPYFKPHSNFLAILLGGGPITPDLLKKCLKRKIPVITSYGMTETCAQIAAHSLLEKPKDDRLLQSVGKIFDGNKIKIRDKSGKALARGSSGTIWLKGPQIFDGYLNAHQSKFDSNGWFNTGDFGRLDEESNLFIETRRTDLIITGGENVVPGEIEQKLRQMDQISDAAVFGIADEEWGQKIAAVIILKKGHQISALAIKNRLKKELENFKIPKIIRFVHQLPRTSTGKVQRNKLLKLLQ